MAETIARGPPGARPTTAPLSARFRQAARAEQFSDASPRLLDPRAPEGRPITIRDATVPEHRVRIRARDERGDGCRDRRRTRHRAERRRGLLDRGFDPAVAAGAEPLHEGPREG